MFNKSARKYQDKFMDVEAYSESLDHFCRILNEDTTILEFGCGPGNISRYLLDKREGLKILGTDLAPEMISLAAQNCPEAKFEVLDIRDLSLITSRFDAVIAGFCLPYLDCKEVSVFIRSLVQILNNNAIVYLSAIERETEFSEFKTSSSGDRVLIHYYSMSYLKSQLASNGFTIVEASELFENDDKEMIIIARLNC